MPTVELTVCALLDTASISPSPSELEQLVAQYRSLLEGVEAMYASAYADSELLLLMDTLDRGPERN